MSIILFEASQLKTQKGKRKTNTDYRSENLQGLLVHFRFSFEKNNHFLSFCKVKEGLNTNNRQ
jgi:hypothetical protein